MLAFALHISLLRSERGMKIIVGLIGAVCSLTTVLLYVSMTTGLGPWMAPTIALVGGVVMRLISRADRTGWQTDIVLLQAVGSTGGALATAVGFSHQHFTFLHLMCLQLGWSAFYICCQYCRFDTCCRLVGYVDCAASGTRTSC